MPCRVPRIQRFWAGAQHSQNNTSIPSRPEIMGSSNSLHEPVRRKRGRPRKRNRGVSPPLITVQPRNRHSVPTSVPEASILHVTSDTEYISSSSTDGHEPTRVTHHRIGLHDDSLQLRNRTTATSKHDVGLYRKRLQPRRKTTAGIRNGNGALPRSESRSRSENRAPSAAASQLQCASLKTRSKGAATPPNVIEIAYAGSIPDTNDTAINGNQIPNTEMEVDIINSSHLIARSEHSQPETEPAPHAVEVAEDPSVDVPSISNTMVDTLESGNVNPEINGWVSSFIYEQLDFHSEMPVWSLDRPYKRLKIYEGTLHADQSPPSEDEVQTEILPTEMEVVRARFRPSEIDGVQAASLPTEVEDVQAEPLPTEVEGVESEALPTEMEVVLTGIPPSEVEDMQAESSPTEVAGLEAGSLPTEIEAVQDGALPVEIEDVQTETLSTEVGCVQVQTMPTEIESIQVGYPPTEVEGGERTRQSARAGLTIQSILNTTDNETSQVDEQFCAQAEKQVEMCSPNYGGASNESELQDIATHACMLTRESPNGSPLSPGIVDEDPHTTLNLQNGSSNRLNERASLDDLAVEEQKWLLEAMRLFQCRMCQILDPNKIPSEVEVWDAKLVFPDLSTPNCRLICLDRTVVPHIVTVYSFELLPENDAQVQEVRDLFARYSSNLIPQGTIVSNVKMPTVRETPKIASIFFALLNFVTDKPLAPIEVNKPLLKCMSRLISGKEISCKFPRYQCKDLQKLTYDEGLAEINKLQNLIAATNRTAHDIAFSCSNFGLIQEQKQADYTYLEHQLENIDSIIKAQTMAITFNWNLQRLVDKYDRNCGRNLERLHVAKTAVTNRIRETQSQMERLGSVVRTLQAATGYYATLTQTWDYERVRLLGHLKEIFEAEQQRVDRVAQEERDMIEAETHRLMEDTEAKASYIAERITSLQAEWHMADEEQKRIKAEMARKITETERKRDAAKAEVQRLFNL